MSRVLIVGNNDGGLFFFRIELLEKLEQEGFEVHFTVPYGDKVEEIKQTGAQYHEVEIDRRGMNPRKDLKLICAYRKLLKEVSPDLILTYTIKPNIYIGILARLKKIPCIATVTGLGSALQNESGRKAKLIKKMYQNSLKRAKAVFFQNQANKDFFLSEKLVEKAQARLVNGSGVNTEKFSPQTVQAEEHSGTNFLYIARIMREKGIFEYMQAAKEVKSKYPDTKFQILGFFDENSVKLEIEKGVEAGYLEYLGVSGDTRREMAHADCIVLPSYHEGMSNVLLEGAASGLPLIASDVPGCKEVIEDGQTGFLCNAQDGKSLAGAMKRFLCLSIEQRKIMGQLGRQKIQREFDRKSVVEKYMQEIYSLILTEKDKD